MYTKAAIRNAQAAGRIYRYLFGAGLTVSELRKAAPTGLFTAVCEYRKRKDSLPSTVAKKVSDTYDLISVKNPKLLYALEGSLADEFIRGYNLNTTNRIKEARLRNRISQSQIAALLGISQQAFAEYENIRFPSVNTLFKISRILGCGMEDLYDEQGIDSILPEA